MEGDELIQPKVLRTKPSSAYPPFLLIPDPLPENVNVYKGFIRRLLLRLNEYYRAKYFNYRNFLASSNGPMFYGLLVSVLRDRGVNSSLFNLLACIYYLTGEGKHTARFKRIQTMYGTQERQLYLQMSRAISEGLMEPQSSSYHKDGRSYRITYRGTELFKDISKEFYKRMMILE
ncbi:MAG TPA: hypothetical protein ENI20_17570 [Bacteroides sp.]|nr:hypothetical protein [Bacteroides sp.]